MSAKNIEQVAEVAETLDNLLGTMQLPMPPAFHLEQLKVQLPELREKLRAVYVAETGENLWA